MSKWLRAARACFAVLSCAPALAAKGPSADAASRGEERVILLLDASASMQGKLGKRTKMDVAREVTHELLKDWDTRILLGLTAYGHRNGSCEDIEAVVPVSRFDAPSFLSQVDGLKPKGKTPITAAVKNAADQLGFATNKATIILVSDGVESCGGDLCALASQLEKQGIDFTAHVVGFGVTEKETKQLACLAQNTGGQYRAVRVQDGELLTSDWDIYEADTKKKVDHQNLTSTPRFGLAPGKYRVKGTCDLATLDYPFVVTAGTNHVLEVSYNSGQVLFKSFRTERGTPIASRVYIMSEDGTRELGQRPGMEVPFELPAGKYQARIWVDKVPVQESARVTRTIEVKPGDKIAQEVNLNVGLIKFRLVASAGGPAIERRQYVYEVSPDGSVGAFVDDLPNNWQWVLAAGKYVLKYKSHGREIERKFSVQAGADTSEEIVDAP